MMLCSYIFGRRSAGLQALHCYARRSRITPAVARESFAQPRETKYGEGTFSSRRISFWEELFQKRTATNLWNCKGKAKTQ
jgi:hypothetical protein